MYNARYVAVIVAALLLINPVIADSIRNVNANFDLGESAAAITLTYVFNSPQSGLFNYTINGAVDGIQAADERGSLEFNEVQELGNTTLEINLSSPANTIKISYSASDVIFQSDSSKRFFTELVFENETNLSIEVRLPEGYGIDGVNYRPGGADVKTDGRRITLAWQIASSNVFLSVKFSQLSKESSLLAFGAFSLAVALIYSYYHFTRRRNAAFIEGFREDEAKTIKYLQKKPEALQRDLQKEFGFSRAKSTRIISILEGKGLVSKERYGRTNKIIWKGR